MAGDGLSTVFQGVEGHGEAQVFGRSQLPAQFERFAKEASDDLKKRKEAAAVEAANLGKVATDKIWDKDQSYFVSATQGLLKGTADFYKKAERNPNWASSEEGVMEKLKLQSAQSDINFKAQGSVQAKEGYKALLDKYNSNPQNYENAHNTKLLADILADPDMTSRNEKLRSAKLKANFDRAASIKKWTENTGSETIVTDKNGLKTTTKNAPVNAAGQPTDFAERREIQYTGWMASPDGKMAIESLADYFEGIGLPVPPPNILEAQLKSEFFAAYDTENKQDREAPRAPSAEEKKIQQVITTGPTKSNITSPLIVTDKSHKDYGKPVSVTYTNKAGEPLKQTLSLDGKAYEYRNNSGVLQDPNDVIDSPTSVDIPITSIDSRGWKDFVPVSYAPEIAIDMKSGENTKPKGSSDYLISSYKKYPYVVNPNGKILIIEDSRIEVFKKAGKLKEGWFAEGTQKATAGDDQLANDKPILIPLTKNLYSIMDSKIKGADIDEAELWGAPKVETKTPGAGLKKNEVVKMDKKSGKNAIWDTSTNPPKFVRWQ